MKRGLVLATLILIGSISAAVMGFQARLLDRVPRPDHGVADRV